MSSLQALLPVLIWKINRRLLALWHFVFFHQSTQLALQCQCKYGNYSGEENECEHTPYYRWDSYPVTIDQKPSAHAKNPSISISVIYANTAELKDCPEFRAILRGVEWCSSYTTGRPNRCSLEAKEVMNIFY